MYFVHHPVSNIKPQRSWVRVAPGLRQNSERRSTQQDPTGKATLYLQAQKFRIAMPCDTT